MAIINMAGFIANGKSIYTQRLTDEIGYKPFYEPVSDNPILEKYYKNRKRYGFALQVYFLNKRFKIIKDAIEHGNSVIDRSIREDIVFSYVNMQDGNISEEEFDIYRELLNNMLEEVENKEGREPELLVYLDAPLEHSLSNIKKRGREYEQIDNDPKLLDYYERLHSAYDNWFNIYEGSKLKIDAEKYDVNKDEDWEVVLKAINYAINAIENPHNHNNILHLYKHEPAPVHLDSGPHDSFGYPSIRRETFEFHL